MKTEQLTNKLPDGYGPSGLPIDKSAPPSRSGVRIGMNLTLMVDAQVNQNTLYPYVIIWNTQTGEQIKVILDDTIKSGTSDIVLSGFRFKGEKV